jgi:hypothetical protein
LETSERERYLKKEPSVQRTKEEKRDHPTGRVPSGLIRRRFLNFLATGSAALAAGSARGLTSYARGEEQGFKDRASQNRELVSPGNKIGGKPTSFQSIEFSATDTLDLSGGFHHNDYVAHVPVDALEGSEDWEDGMLRVKHEYINPSFWSDCTDLEGHAKNTKEHIARENAKRLARVKSILAASTRQDWEADGPRLWVRKGDSRLRIVDLTDDEGRVELDAEWARSAGVGSVALRVELSICQGSELLAKVPMVCVDSGRAFIPWPREDEDGRLVVARWHYDLCRVISPGEYLGAYPVRSYLRRAGIVVI